MIKMQKDEITFSGKSAVRRSGFWSFGNVFLSPKIESKKFRTLVNAPSYYWYNHVKKPNITSDVDEFSKLATQTVAEKRTCLRHDRLYSLFQAVFKLPKNSICIEIGVFQGGSSKFLGTLLRERGIDLYACDTFTGHAEVDSAFDGGHEVNKGFSNVKLENVKKYLCHLPNVKIVVGSIMDTWEQIPDEPIGMIHCDVDVYPATKFVLEKFWDRLIPGGMVVVDDYGFRTCGGCKKAVDQFSETQDNCRVFHLLTGQAVMFKSSGT